MAVTHEVGLPLDLSKGTFANTEHIDGFLQLKVMKISDKGNAIFAESGYWESEVIDIKDKIAAFKRISKTSELVNGATYKIFTSSSEDRSAWSAWEEIDYTDGTIKSPKNSYAKVRIEIKSTMSDEIVTIDDFMIEGKYSNEFVNSDKGVLELKRVYEYEMNVLPSNESISTKLIIRNSFNKINKVIVR
ncbi:hypothetical protein [Paenibacillus bouchesdurhonensis]|uniref:hypothetical protein n=1 Tax=Paenibacillus bouchesdurhonensis TaxID=1870990 RepID=UPI000DA60452|nr:hypothetical protein [Paenibacillus bouchesdurhonensis]